MTTVYERLKALQITLPDVQPPVVDGYVAAFVPFVRTGNLVYLSGRLAKKDGKPCTWLPTARPNFSWKSLASVERMRAARLARRRFHSGRVWRLTSLPRSSTGQTPRKAHDGGNSIHQFGSPEAW